MESKTTSISTATTLAVVLLVFGSNNTPSSVQAGRMPFGVVTTRTVSPISNTRRTVRLLHEAFVVSRSVLQEPARLSHSSTTTSTWQRIPRGGATAAAAAADVDENEKDKESEGEEEVVEADESEEEEEESDVEEEEEDEQEDTETALDDSSQHPLESVMSMKPLAVLVKTSLGNAVLDTSIELTVNRSRNIRSLKESLRRQLPGRPPIQAMELVYQGKRLAEDMLVDELIDEDEEEEEEEEEETSDYQLVLHLDMVPPVDPKFVPQLEQHIQDLTASELLDAYAANEAALYQNAASLMEPLPMVNDENEDGDDEEELTSSQPTSLQQQQQQPQLVSMQIREQANRIRQDLEDKLLHTTHAQKLLANPVPPSAQQQQSLTATQVRGDRIRRTAVAGVRTSIKQKVQHNLNIEWASSIRNFTLFLFFGWFGGRTPLSRAILLLGAPSVFVLQARPVKLWIKQVLYAILDHPPSILLSLLPAPQQAILSLHMVKSMKTLYGDMIAGEYYDLQGDNDEDALSTTPLGPKRIRLIEKDDDDEDVFLLDDDEEEEESENTDYEGIDEEEDEDLD